MDLILSVPGASPEDIARVNAEEKAALERAGFTAEEAAEGAFALEGWDINGAPDDGLDDRAGDAARAWAESHTAALVGIRIAPLARHTWPDSRFPTRQSLLRYA